LVLAVQLELEVHQALVEILYFLLSRLQVVVVAVVMLILKMVGQAVLGEVVVEVFVEVVVQEARVLVVELISVKMVFTQ
jgi:hypothetical protein